MVGNRGCLFISGLEYHYFRAAADIRTMARRGAGRPGTIRRLASQGRYKAVERHRARNARHAGSVGDTVDFSANLGDPLSAVEHRSVLRTGGTWPRLLTTIVIFGCRDNAGGRGNYQPCAVLDRKSVV